MEWAVRVGVEVRVGLVMGLSNWSEEQKNSECTHKVEKVCVSLKTSLPRGELGLQLESSKEVGALEPHV